MLNLFLFGIFPYVAIAIMVVGLIWRYRSNQFSYSSVSSQFLENRKLFWGSVPWHYGIITILSAHLIGVFFPNQIKNLAGVPIRLYIIEITGLALGLAVVVGIAILMYRRMTTPSIRVVTTQMDWVLLAVLLVQVVAGVLVAIFNRWGSLWFVQTATPYLLSLFTLSPKMELVSTMPFFMQLHVVNFFIFAAIFPFSRMVHMLSVPIAYLWRPYQIVVWNRRQIQQ